jgi:uncharacterized protein YdaU (DUF1376 family)
LTERGAYLSLMHHYYATEHPLPDNHIALCRIAGAITKAEQEAVKSVMQFFTKCDSGLMHARIEAELEKAGDISCKNRDIALAREAKRRATREARIEHEACYERAQSVPRSLHGQSTPQTPDTNINTKEAKASSSAEPPEGVPNCPTATLIDTYERRLPTLPGVRRSLFVEGKNMPALRQRWKWVMTSSYEKGERTGQRLATTSEEGVAWFDRYFTYVSESDFLMGRKSDFRANLAWLLNSANFEKVLSGYYHREDAA